MRELYIVEGDVGPHHGSCISDHLEILGLSPPPYFVGDKVYDKVHFILVKLVSLLISVDHPIEEGSICQRLRLTCVRLGLRLELARAH